MALVKIAKHTKNQILVKFYKQSFKIKFLEKNYRNLYVDYY